MEVEVAPDWIVISGETPLGRVARAKHVNAMAADGNADAYRLRTEFRPRYPAKGRPILWLVILTADVAPG